MKIDLTHEAPNVVTEIQLMVLLRRGHYAEVVALEEPERRQAVWYGEWIIRVLNEAKTAENVLVPQRPKNRNSASIEFRVFKTGYGLMSFLRKAGFENANIPMVKGGRTIHKLPDGLLEELSEGDS